ncbi:MAG: endonuclease V [Leptonema sp. (in: bacteria)]
MSHKGLQLYNKAIEEYSKTNSLRLAIQIQNRYSRIILKNISKWDNFILPKKFIIGGIDVTFENDLAIAGIVFLNHNLEIIEKKYKISKISFPYITGFLSFRELSPICNLMERVPLKADLLCFDGQGVLHPRFFGIACHGGLVLDIPSIGIGKTRLVGDYNFFELYKNKKSIVYYKKLPLGWAILTGKKKPIFVSSGWKVGLYKIPEIITQITKYRIPEPTRLAHLYLQEIKKKYQKF